LHIKGSCHTVFVSSKMLCYSFQQKKNQITAVPGEFTTVYLTYVVV
jgi:hypothetical protein